MIEYIKMIIIALFSGVMMPLPVSSAAHYSLLTKVMSCSENEAEVSFYYWIFTLIFSLVVFVFLRKIYFKSMKSLFVFDKQKLKERKLAPYKKVMKNILLSLIPAVLLFIPVSSDSLVIDYFDRFLTDKGFFLTAFACVINALILVVSIWYTRQDNAPVKRTPETRDVMRMSFYHLLSFVVPGFSHVGGAATNFFMSDLHPKVVMRDVYLYIAPQMLLVSIVQIVRAVTSDLIFNPVLVIIAAVISAIVSAIVIHFAGKFSIRRLLGFFGIYSVFLGIAIALCAFII